MWKDPRTCLLLPHWRPTLGEPLAAVLVWRDPLAVADSLHRRDGMDHPLGIALWERYNRAALANLEGTDTFVTSYEDLMADPLAGLTALADWLGSLPQFRDLSVGWDVGGAAATMTGSDRPAPVTGSGTGILLPEQERLRAGLAGLAGGHLPLGPTEVGGESVWTTALIASRRDYRSRDLDYLTQEHAAELGAPRTSPPTGGGTPRPWSGRPAGGSPAPCAGGSPRSVAVGPGSEGGQVQAALRGDLLPDVGGGEEPLE